jgi:hypothetical protein
MTRPGRISSRDLESLSAYLDGQLSRAEAASMETRLRDDAALREALDGLRQTKAALASLPVLRPPRSFTLTPEMAGIRPRRRAYPALRLATAIATVAFLAVSGLDALSRSLGGVAFGPAAPAPAAEQLMMEAPSESDEGVEAERSAMLAPTETPIARELYGEDALWATPPPPAEETFPFGVGGGLPQPTLPPTPLGIGGGPAGTPVLGAAALPSSTSTPTPTPTATPTPTPTLTPSPIPSPTMEPSALAFNRVEAERQPALSLVQWIELLLAGTVVVFAVLSLWARREP